MNKRERPKATLAHEFVHVYSNVGNSFTAVLFLKDEVAVLFPADPNEYDLPVEQATERRNQLKEHAKKAKIEFMWPKWSYFEVVPAQERLHVRYYIDTGESVEATDEVLEKLTLLAKGACIPTIGTYYKNICCDREATGSLSERADSMLASWKGKWLQASVLREKLCFDRLNRMSLVKHYKHGWHCCIKRGGSPKFIRAKNALIMLNTLIQETTLAAQSSEPIEFTYCLRELLVGDDIVWADAPELTDVVVTNKQSKLEHTG